jgi:hypothetical protein
LKVTGTTDAPPADVEAYFYAVSGLDEAGNEGEVSNSVSFAMPLMPLMTSPSDGASFLQSAILVTGTAQAGVLVEVRSALDVLLGSQYSQADGSFSVPLALVTGNNSLKADAVTSQGHRGPDTGVITVLYSPLPQAPANLQVSPGDTFLTLTWQPSTDPDVVGYNIYRDNNGFPLNLLLLPKNGPYFFKDLALTNGRTYLYSITSRNAGGRESAKSAPVSGTPQAGAGWGSNQ